MTETNAKTATADSSTALGMGRDSKTAYNSIVSPMRGRLVVARGAILHRATVPTRDCPVERLTIAYKLRLRGDLSGV